MLKALGFGASQMVQWVRVFAKPENLSFVLGAQVVEQS